MEEKAQNDSSFRARKWAISLLAHLLLLAMFSFVVGNPFAAKLESVRHAALSSERQTIQPSTQPELESEVAEALAQPAVKEEATTIEQVTKPDAEIARLIARDEADRRSADEAAILASPPLKRVASSKIQMPRDLEAPVSDLRNPPARVAHDSPAVETPTPAEPTNEEKPKALTPARMIGEPVFPNSLKRRFRGTIEWRLSLSSEGRVRDLVRLRGTGDEFLDELVEASLRETRFTPAENAEGAVASTLILEIEVR